jgi:ADP-ribose pyrophosphatase
MNKDHELVWEGIHFRAYHENVEVKKGVIKTFEYVWRRDGTRTIALDKDQNILLTREYRHELQAEDWRIPGGKLDDTDTSIEEAARREFKEETGYSANTWQFLWSTTPDSTVRYQRHFFLATDLTAGESDTEDGEKITYQWISLKNAEELIFSGEIKEEISAFSILRIMRMLKDISI